MLNYRSPGPRLARTGSSATATYLAPRKEGLPTVNLQGPRLAEARKGIDQERALITFRRDSLMHLVVGNSAGLATDAKNERCC